MEGYHLRSRSVPREHTRTLGEPSLVTTAGHVTTEGPVEGFVSVGHSLLSAGRPGPGVPSLGSYEDQASSNRSGASLRALLANPPQEIPDVRARPSLHTRRQRHEPMYGPPPASHTWQSEPPLMLGLPLILQSWMWLLPLMLGQLLAEPWD